MPEPDSLEVTDSTALITVGHGTLNADEFSSLVRTAGVGAIVDVRSIPASRRHPHFARAEMEDWLPGAGVEYRWEPALGGFRKPRPDSPNVALRHPSFRGYADYMASPEFAAAADRLLDQIRSRARQQSAMAVAVMCSETLWWRCHRRLIADQFVLVEGLAVIHLMHDGRLGPHRPTEGVRRRPGGQLVYDVGFPGRLDL